MKKPSPAELPCQKGMKDSLVGRFGPETGDECMLQAGHADLPLSAGSHLGAMPHFTTLDFRMVGVGAYFDQIKTVFLSVDYDHRPCRSTQRTASHTPIARITLRTIPANARANAILPNRVSLLASRQVIRRRIDRFKPRIGNWEKAARRVEVCPTNRRTRQGRG
jgi:hypothetical protein